MNKLNGVHFIVDGESQHYLPTYDTWKGLDPSESEKNSRIADALRLSHAVWRFYFSVTEMLYDIQHDLFRLGKLAGLTGERLLAYKDRIGTTSRLHIQHTMGVTLPGIGLFEEDMALEGQDELPHRMEGGWDPVMILGEDVFVCIGDTTRRPLELVGEWNVRPVFDHEDCFNACHPKALFTYILNEEGVSMINEVLELGVLMFGELPDPDEPISLNPARRSQTELFAAGVRRVFGEAFLKRVREWSAQELCVPCPKCLTKEEEATSVYLPHLTTWPSDGQECAFCGNTGVSFTYKIYTTKPRSHNFKAPFMRNVMFHAPADLCDPRLPHEKNDRPIIK